MLAVYSRAGCIEVPGGGGGGGLEIPKGILLKQKRSNGAMNLVK